MTVISVLNFVFGGWRVLGSFLVFATGSAISQGDPNKTAPLLFLGMISLLWGAVAIIAGVGLMQVARWARGWTLAYAIVAIAGGVISLLVGVTESAGRTQLERLGGGNGWIGAAITIAFACSYPIVVMSFLRSTKWKEAFDESKHPMA